MVHESRQSPATDTFGRPVRSLRLSVTDRCNLRCTYCMPEADYVWLPRSRILDFDEVERLVRCFADLGVDKLRLTGGEPLVRQDLAKLVARLVRDPRITDVALTTNGLLLPRFGEDLVRAGVSRVTVSLDTLRPDRFRSLAGRDGLEAVVAAVRGARAMGFRELKINTVVLRGANDDEIHDFLAFGREVGAQVRFIEYMDVGGATQWSDDAVVPRREILSRLAARHGELVPVAKADWAPADRYCLLDGTEFGVISSTTEPFCSTCDRSRLTADGHWFTCLYGREGFDLRGALRAGATDDELRELIASRWSVRRDRGAEDRLLLHERARLADRDELRANPHLEMHTRGG